MRIAVGILVWIGTGSFCLGLAALLVVGVFRDHFAKED